MWIITNNEGDYLVSNHRNIFIFSNDFSQAKQFESERHTTQFLRKWKRHKGNNYNVEFRHNQTRKAIK